MILQLKNKVGKTLNFNTMRDVLKECDLIRQVKTIPPQIWSVVVLKKSNMLNIRHAPKSTEVSDIHTLALLQECVRHSKSFSKDYSNEFLETKFQS